MKVIGKKLGLNSSDNSCRNMARFMKDTLISTGLFFDTKEVRKLNAEFNKILLYFQDDKSYLKAYLSVEGYSLVGLFSTENDLFKYLKEKRIKVKIRNGEILIGNIFDINNRLTCNGLVLASKINNTTEEVDDILSLKNINNEN